MKVNRVILCGRLVRDPEVRYTQSSNPMAVAKFTLAVDRKYKKDGEQNADFINCTAFGKTAEIIEKHVKKGVKLIIEGRWQTGSYKNKDGNTVYTNDCAVESIEFCESKNSQQNGDGEVNNHAPQTNSGDKWMTIPDDVSDSGLPF